MEFFSNQTLINDAIQETPILITVEPNKKTFYALESMINNQILQFVKTADSSKIKDLQTQSIWLRNGKCIDGKFKGLQLKNIQSYQEFWHSWKYFHPNTTTFPK